MLTAKNLILSLCLLASSTALAVPAKPGQWRTIKLTDGTEVRAQLCGDEFCHYWLADDGSAYALNDDNAFERIDLEATEASGRQRRALANAARATRAVANTQSAYEGQRRGLIILVQFPARTSQGVPSVEFTTENAQEYYDRVANEKNFCDPEVGFKSSVYDYFYAQSEGACEFNFDVVGPYKLGNDYTYYGQDSGTMLDLHLGQLIYDACRKADADVDFSKYDYDGDGKVDQVFVLYAGQGQNVNGENTNLIWPQEGVLSSVGSDHAPFQYDDVTIDTFACSCELGENNAIDGIGTICHEFSHCLGLPDTYDRGTTFGATELHYGTYVWDIMNMGNYLDGGFQPAGYTAYERMYCGWKTLTPLTQSTTVSNMKALSEGGEAYIIYNDGNTDEFYILENRQLTGCDAGLYGAGLMITHINYSAEAWSANDINTSKERMAIVAADNSWLRTEDDVKGDLYPYNGNNKLTSTSQPAATLTNANTDGSYLLKKDVTDITQNADGTISFTFTNNMPSGIINIATDEKPQGLSIFNLKGQRITNQSQMSNGALYIINGEKVIKQ
ncbi:MAG: M6 family metalloprotease domain-containing protein [Muribaculaceae bacterium]